MWPPSDEMKPFEAWRSTAMLLSVAIMYYLCGFMTEIEEKLPKATICGQLVHGHRTK
jgi:hypothetical protein